MAVNPSHEKQHFVATRDLDGLRLDRALSTYYPQAGRRAIGTLISAGKVRVNGKVVWLCSWKLRTGDRVELADMPEHKPEPILTFDERWIIADENELLVINKPEGLLSQAPRWRKGAANLLDLAIARFGPLTLFHRLDRDTSGVVVLTCSAAMNRLLDTAFKQRQVEKEYVSVVKAPNRLEPEGEIRERIDRHEKRRDMMRIVAHGGKPALTRYRCVQTHAERAWVRLWPVTGRTHQLRVHMAHLEAPILGDRLYAPAAYQGTRLLLHAHRLVLPIGPQGKDTTYVAPIPPGFEWPDHA